LTYLSASCYNHYYRREEMIQELNDELKIAFEKMKELRGYL